MNEIFIYDEIGPDWWGLVSAQYVSAELAKFKDKPVTVRINSPGGDVFEGQAIYNALRRHGKEITVEVDSLAASAASFIAMAGDKIRIAENAMLMIHNAWTITMGDKAAHEKQIDLLAKVDATIRDTYAARSGKRTAEEIGAMLAAETWLTAAEAVDAGLADEIGQRLNVAPAALKNGRYKHTPAALIAAELPREQARRIRQQQLANQIRLTRLRSCI